MSTSATEFRGEFNNYRLAGNLCNAFAIGEIGAADDFFLIGAEPPDESFYPLITGNFFDSEGSLLFRLERNVLTGPHQYQKIRGDLVGYEIRDTADVPIFRVETKHDESLGYVTTIKAKLYDKQGKLVFDAHPGASDERIEGAARSAFGFAFQQRTLGTSTYPPAEEETVKVALETRGEVCRLITGEHVNEVIVVDGAILRGATLRSCTLIMRGGKFGMEGCSFDSCNFEIAGSALLHAKLQRDLLEAALDERGISLQALLRQPKIAQR